MSTKLFTLKNGEVVINRVEILTIPAFTKVLHRDKGSKGDADGRKKLMAFKEFAYIYHVADVGSTPNKNGYTKHRAHIHALNSTGLASDYKPDDIVNEAIIHYKNEQASLPRDTILELIKTYGVVNRVVKGLRENLEDLATKDKLTNDQAREALGIIDTLITQGDMIPRITVKLTTAISQLEQLDEKENRDIMRGTDEYVPDSAYPDKQL